MENWRIHANILSTLTEVDYERSLDSIEQNYDQDPEMSWKERARVKNLRKSENYNSELEVIAKMIRTMSLAMSY